MDKRGRVGINCGHGPRPSARFSLESRGRLRSPHRLRCLADLPGCRTRPSGLAGSPSDACPRTPSRAEAAGRSSARTAVRFRLIPSGRIRRADSSRVTGFGDASTSGRSAVLCAVVGACSRRDPTRPGTDRLHLSERKPHHRVRSAACELLALSSPRSAVNCACTVQSDSAACWRSALSQPS